jgi:hypothetical protein
MRRAYTTSDLEEHFQEVDDRRRSIPICPDGDTIEGGQVEEEMASDGDRATER